MKSITMAAVLTAAAMSAGFPRVVLAQAAPPDSTIITFDIQEKSEEISRAGARSRADLQKAARELREVIGSTLTIPALEDITEVNNLFSAQESRIDIDLDNVPLKDGLKRIFSDAKQEYDIDADVPSDTPVTLKAKKIRLSSALEALTDQAGIGWSRVLQKNKGDKEFKTRYRFVRSAARPGMPVSARAIGSATYTPRVPTWLSDVNMAGARGANFVFTTMEQRQTFNCPHCKGQITTVKPRPQHQPQCPKCSRTFEAGWTICPFDGAKRPSSATTWRYCPLCGKPVDMENSDDQRASVRERLEPGCQVKIHVISTPDDKEYSGVYPIDSAGRLRLRTFPVSMQVAGYTALQLEEALVVKLKSYMRDPKVTATIVSK